METCPLFFHKLKFTIVPMVTVLVINKMGDGKIIYSDENVVNNGQGLTRSR